MKLRRRFRTVYIDPPWPERGGGKICRGAQRHYPVMTVPEIQAAIDGLVNFNSRYRLSENAHCYLWATNNFLPSAFLTMAGIGFRYVTMITWLKGKWGMHPVTRETTLQLQMGLGQYYRGATEHCLFGVRGRVPYRMRDDGKRAQGVTGFIAERGVHSAKPEKMRKMIEDVSPPPYLELFARERRFGWTVWGNEV